MIPSYLTIGTLGIISIGIAQWFQVYKLLKTKKSKDISLPLYVFLVSGVVFYLLHAIKIKDITFMISNTQTLISTGTTLFLVYKYRNN